MWLSFLHSDGSGDIASVIPHNAHKTDGFPLASDCVGCEKNQPHWLENVVPQLFSFTVAVHLEKTLQEPPLVAQMLLCI